jgi:hypothetical protein
VPTWGETDQFVKNFMALTPEQRSKVGVARRHFVEDLTAGRPFRRGLRVQSYQRMEGVYEMAWADDGRALWRYGDEVRPGEPHVIWLAIGTHDIY